MRKCCRYWEDASDSFKEGEGTLLVGKGRRMGRRKSRGRREEGLKALDVGEGGGERSKEWEERGRVEEGGRLCAYMFGCSPFGSFGVRGRGGSMSLPSAGTLSITISSLLAMAATTS